MPSFRILYTESDLGYGPRGCLGPEERDLRPQGTNGEHDFGRLQGPFVAVCSPLEASPPTDLGLAQVCWEVPGGPTMGSPDKGVGEGGGVRSVRGRLLWAGRGSLHVTIHPVESTLCWSWGETPPIRAFHFLLTETLCGRSDPLVL